MEAKAYAKYVRISPRKVSVVLNLIRGKDVKLAKAILEHTPKAACEPLLKLLKSAVANAENNHSMDTSALYVQNVQYPRAQFLRELDQELRVEHLELIRKHLISL